MIEKFGTVTISEDKIMTERFHFIADSSYTSASVEVLAWAKKRVEEELEKANAIH